jgi:hypothetical protein
MGDLSIGYDQYEVVVRYACGNCRKKFRSVIPIAHLQLRCCPLCEGHLLLAGDSFVGAKAFSIRRKCCGCGTLFRQHSGAQVVMVGCDRWKAPIVLRRRPICAAR